MHKSHTICDKRTLFGAHLSVQIEHALKRACMRVSAYVCVCVHVLCVLKEFFDVENEIELLISSDHLPNIVNQLPIYLPTYLPTYLNFTN